MCVIIKKLHLTSGLFLKTCGKTNEYFEELTYDSRTNVNKLDGKWYSADFNCMV